MSRTRILDDTIGDPIVGQYYMVPAIWYRFFEKVAWWPVLGSAHEDAELLRFPDIHYHHDWRFTPTNGYKKARETLYSLLTPDAQMFAWPLFQRGLPVPAETTLKRFKCKRAIQMPEEVRSPERFGVVQKHFAGRPVAEGPRGLICPHRGAPLHHISPDENGVVTCLLHGLRICTRTRRVLAASPGNPSAEART
jgi:hypothetical protein